MISLCALPSVADLGDFVQGVYEGMGEPGRDTAVGRAVESVIDTISDIRSELAEDHRDLGHGIGEFARDVSRDMGETISMGLSEIGRGQDFDAPDYGGGWSSTLTGRAVEGEDD